MIDEKTILQILRETIKVDASGLAPAVVAHRIEGFGQAARRILQALCPGSSGEGWRDIKSAPKDGTPFLAACDRASDGNQAIVYWDEEGDPDTAFGRFTWRVPHTSILHHEQGFTHWRPLPAPPSAMLSAAGER